MPKVTNEHAFTTENANARIVLGKHQSLGVYIEAYASEGVGKQWKRSHACWYEKAQRSGGMTYMPEGPLLLAVLKFMESLKFPKEDIINVKELLLEWGMIDMKMGEETLAKQ